MTVKPHRLWWVRDSSHLRDHFVIAQTSYDARADLHEDEPDRSVRAGCLGVVHGRYENDEIYWPSLKELIGWGFQVIHADDPIVVWKDGALYRYGWEFEGPLIMHYDDAPGVYIIQLRGTHLWKIGLSNELSGRLSGHRRNIPMELVLDRHIPYRYPAKLEYALKRELRPWRYDREWFYLYREQVDHTIAYATDLATRRSWPRWGARNFPRLRLKEHMATLERTLQRVDIEAEHPFSMRDRILPKYPVPVQDRILGKDDSNLG